MTRLRNRRTGFTLVELLVVIAIITVLIAIAMPVYSRVRESVRQKACMANLMQIATAIRLYRMDEGFYPGPYQPATGVGGLNDLYPTYLPDRRTFICPNDSTDTVQYQQMSIGGVTLGELMEDVSWPHSMGNPTNFEARYSSYNLLYNWLGYVPPPSLYPHLPWTAPAAGEDESSMRLQTEVWGTSTWLIGTGASLGLVYTWRCAQEDLTYIDRDLLKYHLGAQLYWSDYDPDSYDESDPTRLSDHLNRPLWYPTDSDWNDFGEPGEVFPGLINRNAPENTIVTRCPFHRKYTTVRVRTTDPSPGGYDRDAPMMGGEYEDQRIPEKSPRDIVLRLDGSCQLVVGATYDWATQPSNLR